MRVNFSYAKYCIILSSLFSFAVHAENKILMHVKSLDSAWEKRQSIEGQEHILDFIKAEEKVPQDFDIDWRVARLAYFCGNFGIGKKLSEDEHVKIFSYGFKTAEIAKQLEPKKAEGYYWYAVDLGSYGLAKGVLSALSNASSGRDALLEVIKIDPSYQWAGAYRVLGRYYQELPGIISFGDKKKAAEYYQKAMLVEPDFILNTLYYAVLVSDLGDQKEALKLLHEAEKLPKLDGKEEEIRYRQELVENIKKVEKKL